jgi:O-antigen/teichoic acid export membrane protein
MLTQKLVLSYSSKIVVQLVQMATSLIVARLVGPTVLGTLAFGLAYVNMFSFIMDLGIGSAHIKLISGGKNEKDCLNTYSVLKLTLVSAYIMVIVSVYSFQKFFFSKPFESTTHEIVILIYLFITVISQFLNIAIATWNARMEQAKQDIPFVFQTILYQIFRVILAILGFRAIGLAFGNLAALIITIPLYLYLARDFSFGKFDKELFRQYLKISTPVAFILIISTVINTSDKVILQYFTNSRQLGFYSAAFTLGSFIKTIELSSGALLFPYFSRSIAQKDFTGINATIQKIERFTFAFILPLGLISSLFSDLIIHFTYGTKFLETVPVFSIIIIAFSLSLCYFPYNQVIFGMGLFKDGLKISIINISLFFIAVFILVSTWSLNLKGVGMALVMLTINLFMYFQLLRYTKKNITTIRVLPGRRILAYAFIYSLVLFFLLREFEINGWIIKLLVFLGSYMLFIALGTLFKIIIKEDFHMIGDLLNVKKMGLYVKSELFSKKKQNRKG